MWFCATLSCLPCFRISRGKVTLCVEQCRLQVVLCFCYAVAGQGYAGHACMPIQDTGLSLVLRQ